MKVLILLGDAGGGHMSAARAVGRGFELIDPQIEVEIVDLSDRSGSFPFGVTGPIWELVSKYRIAELISDTLYSFLNTGIGDRLASWLVFSRGSDLVHGVIAEFKPDIIVSTHFIVSAVLEGLKDGLPNVITGSVGADLVGFPRMLADRNAELIFCATSEAAKRLERFHISPDAVRFPAFPVNPNLQNFRSREDVLNELGFDVQKQTILITGGGVGTISMLAKISEIAEIPNTQKIVICGKNENAYNSLVEKFGKRRDIVLLKFVSNIQDYYNAADVVVAKPGPATIVEIEIFQKKAVFTKIIGKQERGNIAFLEQNPNFKYLHHEQGTVSEIISKLIKHSYVEFQPRFSFESSKYIASELLDAYRNQSSR